MGCFLPSPKNDRWPKEKNVQRNKSCLIIVDVQNDFIEPYGILGVNGSFDIIPKINKLRRSKKFDYIVTSRNWHP